jgi:hypothetical protein
MKRLPLLALATFGLGMIALAAETIRFEPVLGTITKYRTTTQSTAEILNSSIVTSDGQPVPKPFENILETLKTALNTNQTQEITEKVVAVEANGTRQLETTVMSQNAQPPQIGYEIQSSITPEGLLTITSFKFDAATLAQPGFAAISDSLTNSLRDIYVQTQPSIYGKPLDIGQSLKFSSNSAEAVTSIFKTIPEAKIQVEGLQSTLEYTYQGRNASNDHGFKTFGNTTAGKFVIDLGFMNLEQTMNTATSEGEMAFFADGRLRRNLQSTSQTLTQIQKITLDKQVLTLSVSAKIKTISNTEILP